MSILGWIVVLYFSGILLLLAEFFAPGAILGILGGICVVASGIWAAYIYPDQAFAIVIGELIGVLITIIAGVMLITKTRLGRGIMLTDELSPEKGYVSDMTDEHLAIGKLIESDALGKVWTGEFIFFLHHHGLTGRLLERHVSFFTRANAWSLRISGRFLDR